MRARVVVAGCLLAAAVSLGAGNAYAFDRAAAGLDREIAAYVAAGAPVAGFAAAERDISAARPYSPVSGALFRDPLAGERVQAKERWDAWRLKQQADSVDRALGAQSGGFANGEPADIQDLSLQLDQAVTAARGLKLQLDPGLTAQDAAAGYWLLTRELQLELHGAIKRQLSTAIATMKSRVAAKQQAQSLLGQAQTLLGEAQWLGTAGDADAAATAAAGGAVAAAADDDELAVVTQSLQKLLATLEQEANSEPPQPLPTGPCLAGVPAQLIEVHLVTQELIAYRDGCPWLATWVTTGQPALPTVRGTFHIFYKARWFLMRSPWPYGSPYWYPDTWVGYAMEIYNDGTFLHTADWEPPSAFGRGSEYGPYASHGCIHVQDGPAATLFAWAPIGTEVIVGD